MVLILASGQQIGGADHCWPLLTMGKVTADLKEFNFQIITTCFDKIFMSQIAQ